MTRRDDNLQAQLDRDLAELKLVEIAKSYREVLDEAARKGISMSELLALLFGMEQAVLEQRALEHRLREARLREQKTVAEYDFKFPKRVPEATIMRLFNCDFIERHEYAVLLGPTGIGKSYLVESRCGAVVVGLAYLFTALSSAGASLAQTSCLREF
jgi:DNA replication protein DnaC